METQERSLWEIYVPVVDNDGKFFTDEWNEVWKKNVIAITGGMGKFPVVTGIWISPTKEVVEEPMRPVRILASRKQVQEILKFTRQHFSQECVMCFLLSTEIILSCDGE